MRFKKFAAVALSVALATASMPISGLAAGGDAAEKWWTEDLSMELKVPEGQAKLLLGDVMQLTATYTSSNAIEASASNAVEIAEKAEITWEITEGNITVKDGTVSADKYDMNNAEANTATVTASLVDDPSVTADLEVKIEQPNMKVPATLAVSPTQGVSIKPELENVKEGLEVEKYTYTSSAPETIEVTSGGMVTAKNAEVGAEATITVTAEYNGATFAEEKVAVTVVEKVPENESLVWAETAQIPVRLVVGGEYSIPFKSTYNDGFKVVSDNEKIATVAVSEEKDPTDGLFYVKVAAVAEGTANITLSHEGAVDLTAQVYVTDPEAEKKVEANGKAPIVQGIDSEMVDLVANDATVKFVTENPEFAEYATEIEEQYGKLFKEVADNKVMESELANPVWPEDIGDAMKDMLGDELRPGETAVVELVQVFMGYANHISVENGVVKVGAFEELIYEVKPMVTIYNNNEVVDSFFFADETQFDLGENTVKFILPVPESSYTDFRYVEIDHEHDGVAQNWPDKKGTEGERYVEVATKNFSEFTLKFSDTKDNSNSSNNGNGWVKPAGGSTGSGSGSGSTTNTNMNNTKGGKSGQWQQNENGWWFRYTDGTYPTNEWVALEWQNVTNWYFFDAEGYLATGWKQDGATWYYLHPIADGTQGHMYTGWNQINGKWYYFSTVAGGPLGAMLSNTTTPDGYQVGADGAWIQ